MAGNLRRLTKGPKDLIFKSLIRSRLLYVGVPLVAAGVLSLGELEKM